MKATRGRAGTRRRISKEEMAQRESAIISDIKAGILSYREIAHKHSVSLPTVNNKARKAGISRGRRKGARIIVRRPARRTAVRRGALRQVRPMAEAAAPAPVAVRGRRRSAGRPKRARGRVGRRSTRPAAARRGRAVGATAGTGFAQAFRELVLRHNPGISLLKFDRLAKMVEAQVR